MYLNPQIRDTQDTFKIHMGYIEIHLKIRISSPTCGRAWIPPNPRDTCPACILHVSRMYSACIPHVFRMYLDYLWGYMYLACISHVSRMSPSYQIHLSVDAFEIQVSHYVFWMYPTCILITLADTCISHVSRMYPASQIRTSLDTFKRYVFQNVSHMYPAYVSWCIVMYRDEESKIHVSWCILICIQCDTKEAPKIHVSWCIWCVSQNVSWTRLGYV